MRITESQLRRVIRDVIRESYEDGNPGDIASHEYYPDMGMQQSDAGYMPVHAVDTVKRSKEELEALGREGVPFSAEVKRHLEDLIAAAKSMLGRGKKYDVID